MFKKTFLKKLAKKEMVSYPFLEEKLKKARIVIPQNKNHKLQHPVAIGEGLKIKINTNLGLSNKKDSHKQELAKLNAAIENGADTVMDLSVHSKQHEFLKEVIKKSTVPVGTVPLYEAANLARQKRGEIDKITFEDVEEVLNEQARSGVDFFTIHAGILQKSIGMLKRKKRTGGIVSRGGAILARWMLVNKKENFLYTNFDRILKIAKEYNITLSLGDALRPGAIADSTDALQVEELKVLGELVKRSRAKGVQVMVEGPGHIRLDEIPLNIIMEKRICHNAPFYVLGPLPVDTAAGYDHINAAIGGALAGMYGADFLCVVTPAEHLRRPSIEDIRDGTIASKIAAHAVNVLRFKDDWERNRSLSLLRARRKWKEQYKLTLDPRKMNLYRKGTKSDDDLCSMCDSFCSLKMIEKCDLL